ncbi:hypothetical protein LCGC14_2741180 [marine sediment metagenome]|uniref:Single-stranded DNA-binding protein n=1 Tax=marine sediment metagenome TaxID=412755 RepID=A0A0F8ZRI5_9ZZZZ
MYDLNNCFLTGRLTRDPELTYTQSGYAICNFSLAVNRGKKKDSEEEYPAFFFNCFAWGKTGENIQKFFSKGRKILISGSLEHQTWQDEGGSKRSTVKVNVKSFQFMDSKKDGDPAEATSASGKSHEELQAEAEYFKKIRQEQEKEASGENKTEELDLGIETIEDRVNDIPF